MFSKGHSFSILFSVFWIYPRFFPINQRKNSAGILLVEQCKLPPLIFQLNAANGATFPVKRR